MRLTWKKEKERTGYKRRSAEAQIATRNELSDLREEEDKRDGERDTRGRRPATGRRRRSRVEGVKDKEPRETEQGMRRSMKAAPRHDVPTWQQLPPSYCSIISPHHCC